MLCYRKEQVGSLSKFCVVQLESTLSDFSDFHIAILKECDISDFHVSQLYTVSMLSL